MHFAFLETSKRTLALILQGPILWKLRHALGVHPNCMIERIHLRTLLPRQAVQLCFGAKRQAVQLFCVVARS